MGTKSMLNMVFKAFFGISHILLIVYSLLRKAVMGTLYNLREYISYFSSNIPNNLTNNK